MDEGSAAGRAGPGATFLPFGSGADTAHSLAFDETPGSKNMAADLDRITPDLAPEKRVYCVSVPCYGVDTVRHAVSQNLITGVEICGWFRHTDLQRSPFNQVLSN